MESDGYELMSRSSVGWVQTASGQRPAISYPAFQQCHIVTWCLVLACTHLFMLCLLHIVSWTTCCALSCLLNRAALGHRGQAQTDCPWRRVLHQRVCGFDHDAHGAGTRFWWARKRLQPAMKKLQLSRKRLQPARERLQPARKKPQLVRKRLQSARKKLQPARKQFQPAGKNSGGGTQDAHCAS